MSNKKHNIEEIKTVASTPVTPDLGYSKIYPKSDGEWYRLNDAGDESPLGGGGGAVTSVGLALDTVGSDISISDSPITSAGDITLNIPDASSSARGALTSSDWSIFNNKIDGSGTTDQVARWSTTSTLSTGVLYDNDSTVSIGGSPVSSTKLYIYADSSVDYGIAVNAAKSGGYALDGISFGIGALPNIGIRGVARSSTTLNIGILGSAQESTAGTNIGITGVASGGITATIGGHFIATGSNARAVKLEDSTAASYRVLRCLDSSGNAEWTQNLYSFRAVTLSGNGLPASLTASTQIKTAPVLNHGSSDPNAVQIIIPAIFDNGLGSSYNTSTGIFTVPESGWYFVSVNMSLTNYTGWPIGTSLFACVELTNNTATTIILGSSTVDNYQPLQVLLDTHQLVYLGSGQQFRLNILLKGTAGYTKVNTDSIRWAVIRTA